MFLQLTGVASAQDDSSKQKWKLLLSDYIRGQISIEDIETSLGQELEERDKVSLLSFRSPINGLSLTEYFVYYLNAVERCAQSGYNAGFSGIRIRTPQGDYQLVPYSILCTSPEGVYTSLDGGVPPIDFNFDSIEQQILNVLAQKGNPETVAIYSQLVSKMLDNTWEQARIPFISRDGDFVKRAPGDPFSEEMRSKEEFLEILKNYINQYGVCEALEPFNKNLKKTPFGWQADLPDGRTIYGCYAYGYGTWPYSSVYYSLISRLAAQDSSNVLNIREDNGVLLLTIPNSGVYPLLDPNNNLYTIVIVGEGSSKNLPATLLIPVGIIAAFVLALFAAGSRSRTKTQTSPETKTKKPQSGKPKDGGGGQQSPREPKHSVTPQELQSAHTESEPITIKISLAGLTAEDSEPMLLELNSPESLKAITNKVTALLLQSVGQNKRNLTMSSTQLSKTIFFEFLFKLNRTHS